MLLSSRTFLPFPLSFSRPCAGLPQPWLLGLLSRVHFRSNRNIFFFLESITKSGMESGGGKGWYRAGRGWGAAGFGIREGSKLHFPD